MLKNSDNNIAILGAGSWGTTIADILAKSGVKVSLWTFEAETAELINNKRQNPAYLDDYKINSNITASQDIKTVSNFSNIILCAIPFEFMEKQLAKIDNLREKHLIIASKGIDTSSGKLSHELLSKYIDIDKIALFSGASFATDVIRSRPALITFACRRYEFFTTMEEIFSKSLLSLEYSNDMLFVALGGALKNALAIACGIIIGGGYGESARTAVIIQGIKEIQIFYQWRRKKSGETTQYQKDPNQETQKLLYSGILGDLIMTTTSMLSRNTQLGFHIGKGEKPQEIIKSRKSVFEGFNVALYLSRCARQNSLDMPLFSCLGDILEKSAPSDKSGKKLLQTAGL